MRMHSFLLVLLIFSSSGHGFQAPSWTPRTQGTALFAKKAAAKKIQVKMLKNVQGTGQKGDVVQVTPAFFNNKLRPTQSAKVISDEEVQVEQSEKAAGQAAEQKEANEMKEILEETQIKLMRKAGPDGHLFGGIGPKAIMEELHRQVPGHDEFLNRKRVKIISVTDGDGKKIKDIKNCGDFGAKIALTKEISGQLKISVEADS